MCRSLAVPRATDAVCDAGCTACPLSGIVAGAALVIVIVAVGILVERPRSRQRSGFVFDDDYADSHVAEAHTVHTAEHNPSYEEPTIHPGTFALERVQGSAHHLEAVDV